MRMGTNLSAHLRTRINIAVISLWYCHKSNEKTKEKDRQIVFSRQARHLSKTSCRCPKDVLYANLKVIVVSYLEEIFARYIEDVL